jgi:signal transduction histidine kinase
MDTLAQALPSDITEALRRRDKIMSALTRASDVFLRGSLSTWQENVLQVLRELGQQLGVSRVYLCKHKEVTAEHVITALRYEWRVDGDLTLVDRPGFQDIHMQQAGLGRWAGLLYEGTVLAYRQEELPEGERGSFLTPTLASLIVVPVFVENVWWGFLVIEDYDFNGGCSQAELDAFKTVAVTFGAAIRRKRMEEALEAEKVEVMEKARLVGDIARFPSEDPWPVLRISTEGMLTYANRAAEPLLNLWDVGVGEPVPGEWQERASKVLSTMRSKAVDVTLADKTFSLLLVPVLESGYVNVYGHDVTRERELDQLKSDFISMASHELRTPLTSLRWYSERLLMKQDDFTPKQREMLSVISNSAKELSQMVDDLLNISRIERGKMDPEPTEGLLTDVVAGVIKEFEGQAEAKHITISSSADPVLAPFAFDHDWMRRVTMNLLSNAIKYTPYNGTVTVTIKKTSQASVELAICDTGIGIPAEDHEKVFSRFYRSEAAKASGIEGTGLGLNLVKTMVEKSGGSIWFHSEQGKGTTFTVSLPYKSAAIAR